MIKEGKIFQTGRQDRYRMIFPSPSEEVYKDKLYFLKNVYILDDLYQFYCENKTGNSDISIESNQFFEEEEYTLEVNKEGIKITASGDMGFFRAMTSLRQLMNHEKGKAVVFAQIHDKPQFKNRGVMLDISRGRKVKLDFILEIVDYLAGLKYNEFQLYMEDFCFKYDTFPQYTEGYECLSGKDIELIDKYCAERFIELVPNQNGFGHMRSWLDTEEWKHLEVTDGTVKTDTLNILDPGSFELVDKIYGSLLPHFSSKRVHIGLDEAFGLGKFQLEQICKENGESQVFMDWLHKLSELCEKKYGKKVIFWGDMIRDHPEYFEQIPENATPVEWGYEDFYSQFAPKRCEDLQKTGKDYYVAPATATWKCITGRFEMSIFNIRTMAEVGQKYGATGYLLTIWGDGGHPHSFVWELVPTAIAAQYAWNVGVRQQAGWRKTYFVHNAQDYVDQYVLGNSVSRELAKIA